MKKEIITFIALLMLSMQSLQAASPVQQSKTIPVQIMQSMNNPIGLQALESFSGTDRVGKDGPMVKLGLDLSLIYHEHRDYKMKGGVQVLNRPFESSLKLARISNGKIVIDVVAGGDVETLEQELIVLGMENISVYGRMISGLMPIASLEQTATIATLNFARPAYAKAGTGSVTSQGDGALLSDDARTLYGVDGTGITVGTLSDSYDCIGGAAADIASNDLPAGIVVLADETGCGSGSDEGRAMMQIIHDVAPGSSQAFHTAFDGEASFAQGILDLANAGSDIINDDVIYFAEPMFQDGVIAQAIDTVKSNGVAYFSAVGNQADQSYEAQYVSSGVAGYAPGSIRHDFDSSGGTDSLMRVTVPGSTQVIFVLQWEDPFYSVSGAPGADTDMDMILYSSVGTAQAGGIAANIGGDAVEIFAFTTNPGPTKIYQLAIDHVSGPTPGKIKFVYFGNMTINEYATNSGTSYGHPIAAGGQSIGAARYSSTPDYGVSPPVIEFFSSKGGVPVLFDTSGNAINVVRQKPDIVAPDGGDNTFFGTDYEGNGWPNFFGTSAAAPHVAGLAALLLEFDSTLTPDTVYSTMESTAINMDVAGFDFLTGHGLVQATLALASLDDDGDTIPDSQDNCPNDANTAQNDFDNDGLGDVCDPDDDNDGLSDTDELTIYFTNPLLPDTDGDSVLDGVEVTNGTNPNNADTDGDGVTDDIDVEPLTFNVSGDVAPLGAPDGIVNVADLLIQTRFNLGLSTPDSIALQNGDLYPDGAPDGVINTSDLILMMQLVLP
jgi:hypothetical protein